ncbi:MAG TPA: ABC transporter permease [Fimbriimonadaceae bacterium]|nr:ABC transporter permease [Fimbriimonadaceae bacterium]
MNGFASILRKEFMHLRRDRTTLIIALLLPLIQMVIFGYAIDFDVRHIPAVAVDLDHSREGRDYLAQLQATQYLDFVGSIDTPDQAAQMLRSGAARVAVTIPPGFGRTAAKGGNPQVGVMIDGSDAQVSVRARFAFVGSPGPPAPGAPIPRINVLFNPDSKTVNFMIPGLLVVVLQVVTVALTAFSVVREKEMGTLEQLMVTPVGRLALMLGKLLPYAVVAMGEFAVVLFAGDVVFGVQPHGSLIALTIICVPFVIATLALGLLISTLAQTQGQALQFTLLTVMPSILLSGYVSPRETMPGWLYVISALMPATHFMQATRGIIVRGAGFFDLLAPFMALWLIAAVLIGLSTARFRKSVS